MPPPETPPLVDPTTLGASGASIAPKYIWIDAAGTWMCSRAAAEDAVAKSSVGGGRRAIGGDAVRVSLRRVQHVREPGHLEEDPGRRTDVHQHHGQHPRPVLGHAALRGRTRLRPPTIPDVTPNLKYLSIYLSTDTAGIVCAAGSV